MNLVHLGHGRDHVGAFGFTLGHCPYFTTKAKTAPDYTTKSKFQELAADPGGWTRINLQQI
jgi:hypothetical protein